MTEPHCNEEDSGNLLEFSSSGKVTLYSMGMAGKPFSINFKCKPPCEDTKSKKWCEKRKEKGKCGIKGVLKKCKKTCEKCIDV